MWERTYFGPKCPSLDLSAKSMCIRVTSGGNTAAPGPNLIASNWMIGQLEGFLGWWSRGMSIPSVAIVSRSTVLGAHWHITYCSKLAHTLYYAHHLAGIGRMSGRGSIIEVHLYFEDMHKLFKVSR